MTLARIAAAALAIAALAGCTPSPSPSVTTPPITTPSITPSATTTPTSSWTGEEAKIADQIAAYVAWLNAVYTDPNGPILDAPKYLTNVSPTNVQTAVQEQVIKFHNDGFKEVGAATVSLTSVAPAAAGSYDARVCLDTTTVTVTNNAGATVDTGPKRGAALYSMQKGADAVWRIAHIQGVGTC